VKISSIFVAFLENTNFTKENLSKETLAFSLSNLTFISLMSTRISFRPFFSV
jgi:hypothetical protein